jgi:hypothetical protein
MLHLNKKYYFLFFVIILIFIIQNNNKIIENYVEFETPTSVNVEVDDTVNSEIPFESINLQQNSQFIHNNQELLTRRFDKQYLDDQLKYHLYQMTLVI